MPKEVVVTNYKWEGKKLFFKIKTVCGECETTTALLKGLKEKYYKNKPVRIVIKPWLDNCFEAFFRSYCRAWHAPIVLVNHRLVSQGKVVDVAKLKQFINEELEKLEKTNKE